MDFTDENDLNQARSTKAMEVWKYIADFLLKEDHEGTSNLFNQYSV